MLMTLHIIQEVGLCSEVGVDMLRKGGNAADGELRCSSPAQNFCCNFLHYARQA